MWMWGLQGGRAGSVPLPARGLMPPALSADGWEADVFLVGIPKPGWRLALPARRAVLDGAYGVRAIGSRGARIGRRTGQKGAPVARCRATPRWRLAPAAGCPPERLGDCGRGLAGACGAG